MCKKLDLLLLIIIFIALIVGNIIVYKNDFRKIENEFITLHTDVENIKNWTDYNTKHYAAQLEQKIRELPKVIGVSLEDRIQKTISSVVHIANLSQNRQGSGVAWSEDIIVTARHVIDGGVDFEITLNNGDKIKATRAISNKKYDIGFIKLNEKVLKPAKFGSVAETRLGQSLYVIGSPYGKVNFNSVTLGIVSGLNRDQDAIDRWTGKPFGWDVAFTSDSAGHPGNSGCGVFTMDGVVRGILVGLYSPVLIVCMPVDLFINDLAVIEMIFEQQKFYLEKEITYDNGMLISYTSKGDPNK